MSRLLRLLPRARPLGTTPTRLARPYSSAFQSGPSPPRLPAHEQAEFERLQREASVNSGFFDDAPTPATSSVKHATSTSTVAAPAQQQQQQQTSADVKTEAKEETKGTDFNSGIFRGAPPEFDGDVNPKTGEVGGPKNEPLRWGGQGDWSYNGRVTDF